MSDSRYPYTYACDLLRMALGPGELSRSQASRIRSVIADALVIDDEEIAKRLADHFLKQEKALVQRREKQFVDALEGKE
jgi:hypothetical protein